MEIRQYRPEDKAEIVRITLSAWQGVTLTEIREKHFGVIGGKPWRENKADVLVAKCERSPEQVLVAEKEGRVVGYATFAITNGGDVGVVTNNAVDPVYRGQGIGTALVRSTIEAMENAGVKMLEVTTMDRDQAAQHIYEKLGFREVSRSITYFRASRKTQLETE